MELLNVFILVLFGLHFDYCVSSVILSSPTPPESTNAAVPTTIVTPDDQDDIATKGTPTKGEIIPSSPTHPEPTSATVSTAIAPDNQNDITTEGTPAKSKITSPFPTPVSTSIAPDDQDNIVIEGIPTNDEIVTKIVSTITNLSSNSSGCNIYQRVELSLKNFVSPKNAINVDLGTGNASFYNFVIKEESDTKSNKKKTYSTLIGCDSLGKAKVEVTFPGNIRITSNVEVKEIAKASKGKVSKSIREGSIGILFKNISILDGQINDEDEVTKKFSYSQTEVSLDVLKTKHRNAIYKNLDILLNQIESPLQKFFVDELNAKLDKNGISVNQSCSKFIDMEKNSKHITLTSSQSDLNNLFVLSNVSQAFKAANLSNWNVVIRGLSHFNSAELVLSGTEISTEGSDGYYHNTCKPDEPEKKEITVRIKTDQLEGKIEWSYNMEPNPFYFFIDFVKFEVKKSKIYRYWQTYHSDSYTRSQQDDIDIVVYLGDIQIKSSKCSACEKEKKFVDSVLSDYILKTVWKNSIKNLLAEKLRSNDLATSFC